MKIRTPQHEIDVFTITPRTLDPAEYWPNIERTIEWSDEFDCTGVLLFTGNDTFVEPWLLAQAVCERSRSLSPLVAVNPIYMHPFTTAKMVSSCAYLYGRRSFLNLVTGTAVSYLHALDDELGHDERYDRLRECAEIIRRLVGSTDPVTYDGKYYRVRNLELHPATPADLQPRFLLAGQSDAAVRTARAVDGIHMQMLPSRLAAGMTGGSRGVHFGIVTRAGDEEAWSAAHALFPEDRAGRRRLQYSMSNTDSVWKRRLQRAAGADPDPTPGGDPAAQVETGYWLEPFGRSQADCPYLVGSYVQVAGVIRDLIAVGVDTFILDLPARRREFAHADRAFAHAAARIASEVP